MADLISKASFDLIVDEEVSGRRAYEARYRHPTWPGGGSGVTIGIGYDVGAGVGSAAQLRSDWKDHMSAESISWLTKAIGVTGDAAATLARQMRAIDVPWDDAIAVFTDVDIPKWFNHCVRLLPNFAMLSPDCRGALVSLAYNRGASFDKQTDRYREMRNIAHWMLTKQFDKIPAEFRSMQRLWATKSMRGLVARREHEAVLFEHGLEVMKASA